MSTNSPHPPNRLAAETSPYLLQHAFNPVDWYPWGDEAFDRAAVEQRPILLSVGYSACHWCHVMERESFENFEIAEAMNRDFVCIKVDREERPDVDAIYMNAVQMLTGQGGWPMTVFLTPDKRPFYGGTYFPPIDHYGRPGFPRVLEAISNAWRTQRSAIEAQGAELTAKLNDAANMFAVEGGMLTAPLLDNALASLSAQFDNRNGGFGSSPKFPQPAVLDFLLRMHRRFHRDAPLQMVELTLQKMALGGIYDQLRGGFHRYSTDAVWLAPHFEKMLYDNAQLAQTYCRAYQITGKLLYRDVAAETLEYVLREMTNPETGAFYSAQDADSEGEEGRFFVWSRTEVVAELGEPAAALFCDFYDVTEQGNWEGKSILRVVRDVSEVAARHAISAEEAAASIDSSRSSLLAIREQRIKPGRDDKSLTAWNSLALSALAECGAALKRVDFIAAAVHNAEFIEGTMAFERNGRLRLLRTSRNGEAKLNGYLEDYSFFADALIHLYMATQDVRWLSLARRVAASMVDLFLDADGGGFFATSSDHEKLLQRLRDWDDNATPSGNSVALEVLLKLAAHTGDSQLQRLAGSALRRAAPIMEKHPYGFARLLGVVDLYLEGPLEIVIAAANTDGGELLQVANDLYLPNKILLTGSGESLSPLLKDRPPIDGKATAYVCRGSVCSLPITTVDHLRAELAK